MSASAKGCGTQTQLFELSQGEKRVDLALERGFTLAGSLSTDFPTERLGVALTPDPEWLGNVHQGRDGSFRFEDLRPGTYVLRTQAFVPERRQPYEQEHRIDLERDILDFQARMSSKRVQVSLSTNLDFQRGFLSGNLTARGPQQQFLQRPFRIYHRSGTGSQAVEVELPPGLWELDLEVAGHHPWSSRVNLLQDQTLPVSLRLLEGRALNVSLEGKVYYVETRKEGTAEWLPLASDRDTTRPRTSPLPTTPWLASGTYDFRISTERGLETILERVVMEPNPEPYILSITLPAGLDVTGTLVSDLPTGSDLPLHLSVHEEVRWRLLPAKESFALRHPARPAYPNCEFFFFGLRPGKYRMCADREGQIVLAEWILRDRDLHPIVEHSFLR